MKTRCGNPLCSEDGRHYGGMDHGNPEQLFCSFACALYCGMACDPERNRVFHPAWLEEFRKRGFQVDGLTTWPTPVKPTPEKHYGWVRRILQRLARWAW